MRKSAILAAAILAAMQLPAQAAKYTCTFFRDGNPIGQPCSLDTATSGKMCEYKFSSTLTGTCLAQTGAVNLLACWLSDPNKAVDLARGQVKSQADVAHVLAEQPGFAAVGAAFSLGSIWPNNALVAYRENLSGPTLQAGCTE
ncbi:hypothetical protein [Bradyrhizobium sp. HKCCYLRH3073]|uniref:hypothetical protein n=1 Tax=unclassified Bradyrhizobium TaxID=2631580 RepID=UPI003EBC566C